MNAANRSTAASIYDPDSIEWIRRNLAIEPLELRRFKNAFFKKSHGVDGSLPAISHDNRNRFAEKIDFHPLSLHARHDSFQDGASKLLFRTKEKHLLESIILRASTGRVALCLSSQVGCAAKCSFCATGQMGLATNLSPAQILDQVAQANELLRSEGRRVRNIVFMGMGEPLHNLESVRTALRVLTSADSFDHPASRILVSTVGVTNALISLAEDFPGANYAISLHSVDPATRSRLIPLNKQHSLDSIREAIAHLNKEQAVKRSVMIEYLMLDGTNDSQADANCLASWLRGLRVHLNLIPYNKVDAIKNLSCSPRTRIEAFGATMKSFGIPTTIRYSMGSDIDAACGQLVQENNRMKKQERKKLLL